MKKILVIMLAGLVSNAAAVSVTNLDASSLTTTSATMRATFSGITSATGTIYYGTVDYTTNAGLWAYTNAVAEITNGVNEANITGLSASHKYYYRWKASQDGTDTWSATTVSFWTKPIAPTSTPTVVTISVQTDTNAELKSPTNFFGANAGLIEAAGFATAATVGAIEERVIVVETGKLDKVDATYTDTVWKAGTAWAWGDHSTNNYATGTPVYVESDPVFAASVAGAISGADTASWHQAAVDGASWTNNKLASNDGGDLTNVSAQVDYGITDATAYRGDWGDGVSNLAEQANAYAVAGSNLAYTASTNAEAARVTADAALPKSFTNAAAVANLAITGGAVTGGVWVCTNSVTGEGTIQGLPKIYALKTDTQVFTNIAYVKISWNSIQYQRGGTLSGGDWTPGVVGWCVIVYNININGAYTGECVAALGKNANSFFLQTPRFYMTGAAPAMGNMWQFYNDHATNVYSVWQRCAFGANVTNIATLDGQNWFSGAVLP